MIEPVIVLHGHTDPDTAYVVDDYPYGYRLRCKIRYWIETATKGAAKGQMRFVSQTTNPKVAGEAWNKPKASTYCPLAVMYLEPNGHIQWIGAGLNLRPVDDMRLRLMGVVAALNDRERALYDALLRRSKAYARQWDEWTEHVNMIAAHLAETGADDIETVNGIWKGPNGEPIYLSEPDIYVAIARTRMEQEPDQ